ncbi:MAG TPA: hypothetical protein VIV57_02365, partial [Anaeromyxobacter sp.]
MGGALDAVWMLAGGIMDVVWFLVGAVVVLGPWALATFALVRANRALAEAREAAAALAARQA